MTLVFPVEKKDWIEYLNKIDVIILVIHADSVGIAETHFTQILEDIIENVWHEIPILAYYTKKR
jgi:hypothetical protein